MHDSRVWKYQPNPLEQYIQIPLSRGLPALACPASRLSTTVPSCTSMEKQPRLPSSFPRLIETSLSKTARYRGARLLAALLIAHPWDMLRNSRSGGCTNAPIRPSHQAFLAIHPESLPPKVGTISGLPRLRPAGSLEQEPSLQGAG